MTSLLGLHHVTATVDDAQPDLDFCVGLLGLRLVKQTVNFDNHRVYHFYYGDQHGTPGTIWTTFPYRGQGVRVGALGAGQVVTTAFAVPAAALDFWQARMAAADLAIATTQVLGETHLTVRDPSGLDIHLVGVKDDPRVPWTIADIPAEAAVRGLHSVRLLVNDPAPTLDFLQDALGCTIRDEGPGGTRLAVGPGGSGAQLDVAHDAEAARGRNGLGTVHHVALAIDGEEAQAVLRDELVGRGVEVTPFRDRQYFRSIYFREPGGVLIEVATVAPGFTCDEPLEALGTALQLPAWQEPNRSVIAAGLPPITLR